MFGIGRTVKAILSVGGKVIAIVAFRSFAPVLWPGVQLAVILSSKFLRHIPHGRHIPPAIERVANVLQPLCLPVVLRLGLAIAISHVLPDQWRTLQFWDRLLPIYAGYMKTKIAVRHLDRPHRDEKWEVRHEWGGKKVYDLVLHISGFYVKSAQIMASKGEFMPQPWVRRLSQLFDSVPPRPFAQVLRSIKQELSSCPRARASAAGLNAGSGSGGGNAGGKRERGGGGEQRHVDSGLRVEDVFESIDEEALAAASIAQVHLAVLLESPPESDAGAPAGMVLVVRHLSERERSAFQMCSERRELLSLVEAEAEAEVLTGCHAAEVNGGGDEGRGRGGIATKGEEEEGEVDEFVDAGRKLERHVWFADNSEDEDEDEWHDCVEASDVRRQVVIKVQHLGMAAVMRSDLRNIGRVANFLSPQLPFDLRSIVKEIQETIPLEFNFDREVAFMRVIKANLRAHGFDCFVVCPNAVVDLCTPRMIVMERLHGIPFTRVLAWLHAPDPSSVPSHAPSRAQACAAVEGLLRCFGAMFLLDGVFHADPHPGNLLLLPDGRIGLLDFGQSKILDGQTRTTFAELVLALSGGNPLEIVAALVSAGMYFGGTAEQLQAFVEKLKDIGSKGRRSREEVEEAHHGMNGDVNGTRYDGREQGGSEGEDSSRERGVEEQLGVAEEEQVEALVKLAYLMFDTRPMAEGQVSPLDQESVLQKAPLTGFNQALWLVVRSMLLLRGLTFSVGCTLSAVEMWKPYAEAALCSRR